MGRRTGKAGRSGILSEYVYFLRTYRMWWLMPVFAAMYSAVAASTPPRRKPVIPERMVNCGMLPRKTFLVEL